MGCSLCVRSGVGYGLGAVAIAIAAEADALAVSGAGGATFAGVATLSLQAAKALGLTE
jgi:hypothetical protein